MYEYIFVGYVGVLVILLFNGYKYIYKIDYDNNSNDDNHNDEFKYSLFNETETNDLNKLLLEEHKANINLNNNDTMIQLKMYNFKENMNEGIDKMFSSIKKIYKNKPVNTRYSQIINEPILDNNIPYHNDVTLENIELTSRNINYSNNQNENITYIEDDLGSTINTMDLNMSLNTDCGQDKSMIINNNISDNLNTGSGNEMFHSVMSR
tara:strand:+ start:1029 stop:1652 length:624 start_codon:yes stop_codon:yes gene_type:complete